MGEETFDYIVVGSGAGGGPLACNLARQKFKVALVEAGRDPAKHDDESTNYNYLIPALHGRSTEDPDLSWEFFVQHYDQLERQKQNMKYYDPAEKGGAADPLRTGVFYPRAGTLGGCTAHNAMITVYPHNEDWENIRTLTGDDSWSAEHMRSYFEKLEDCKYSPVAPNEGRHGFGGWLSTSLADPYVAVNDSQIQVVALAAIKAYLHRVVASAGGANQVEKLRMILKALAPHLAMIKSMQPRVPPTLQMALAKAVGKVEQLRVALDHTPRFVSDIGAKLLSAGPGIDISDAVEYFIHELQIDELIPLIVRYVDPNDWRVAVNNLQGVFAVPLATNGVVRRGTREFIVNTQGEFPNRLFLLTDSLVTRVLFEETRAVGVEVLESPFAYRASPRSDRKAPLPPAGTLRRLTAKKEVILAGGTFNTPQLLMLSGIGPRDILAKHKIETVNGGDWPGVGRNLHDRYEIGVISEMEEGFEVTSGCPFEAPKGDGSDDRCFVQWKERESGLYTTNGVILGIVLRSKSAETAAPDLFIFGLPGYFPGYHPGYAAHLTQNRNAFTWAILKGHTRNRAGEVTLRSDDPRDPPVINFKYFDNGSPGHEADQAAIVEAVQFINEMMKSTGQLRKFLLPNVPLDDEAKLREFIANQAWGHHACGTCKMGRADDAEAVVDSRFRVRGVQNLRIVDASVFPAIPGFFIASAIYMISEKASDVIINDAH
jgi:choline dehydrogenase-like flavoprotein